MCSRFVADMSCKGPSCGLASLEVDFPKIFRQRAEPGVFPAKLVFKNGGLPKSRSWRTHCRDSRPRKTRRHARVGLLGLRSAAQDTFSDSRTRDNA